MASARHHGRIMSVGQFQKLPLVTRQKSVE
jgi:hypothetical protein